MNMKKFLLLCGIMVFAFSCGSNDESPVVHQINVIGGTASPKEAVAGTKIKLTPNPVVGSEFLEWTSDDVTVDANDEFIMPDKAVEVRANFDKITYNIVVEGGYATLDGAEVDVATSGTEIVLVAEAPAGKELNYWDTEDATVVVDRFSMPANDVSLTAVWRDVRFNLTLTKCEVMDELGESRTAAALGEELTLTFDGEDGERLLGWETSPEIEIVETETPGVYSFVMIGEPLTITADWEVTKEPYILYWDGTKLDVGNWGIVKQDNMVFTQFGGIAGFTVKTPGDPFDQTDLIFNPNNTPAGEFGWGFSASQVTSMRVTELTDTYVTDQHTQANLLQNWGDICKLVGLTPAQAKGRIDDGSIMTYDSGYRLPTKPELEAWFVNTVEVTIGGKVGRSTNGQLDGFLPLAGARQSGNVTAPDVQGGTKGIDENGFYGTASTSWPTDTMDPGAAWGLIVKKNNAQGQDETKFDPYTLMNATGRAIKCVPTN